MAKFKDREGKEWSIDITIGHLKALREDFGIDLRTALKPDDTTFAEKVLADLEQLGRVLWVFCGPQAEKAGLDEEAFAFRFDGETVERAATALWQALWDFSRPRTGERAASLFRKGLDQIASGTNDALDKMSESPIWNNLAGNSAGLSASTPVRSHSAS